MKNRVLNENLNRLAEWYIQNHRKLPFRENPTEYTVYVSEVMLQQTRVAAMLPLYQEFIKAFPDFESLARAPEERVLEKWKGLGYYNRARNLHQAARQITAGGGFPRTYDQALQLKGAGPYTAAAVLSIVYNQSIAVYDGNVRRVLSRYFYNDVKQLDRNYFGKEYSPKGRTLLDKHLKEKAQMLISKTRHLPSVHNQAVMEAGAVLCKPKSPLCSQCPLQSGCDAKLHHKNKIELLFQTQKKKKTELEMHVYICHNRNRQILLEKNENRTFFRKDWFFPYDLTGLPKQMRVDSRKKEGFTKQHNVTGIRVLEKKIRHTIMHYNLTVICYTCTYEDILQAGDSGAEYMFADFEQSGDYIISSLGRKIFRLAPLFIHDSSHLESE